jgi:hypothetical protein
MGLIIATADRDARSSLAREDEEDGLPLALLFALAELLPRENRNGVRDESARWEYGVRTVKKSSEAVTGQVTPTPLTDSL